MQVPRRSSYAVDDTKYLVDFLSKNVVESRPASSVTVLTYLMLQYLLILRENRKEVFSVIIWM